MPRHKAPARVQVTPVRERESAFLRMADWVSEAMGRPGNIAAWAVAVVAWTVLFAVGGSHIASGAWLPGWFTSQGYNFPLNLVTTVAELFIGFLVAAATNRAERALMRIIDGIRAAVTHIGAVVDRVSTVEDTLKAAIDANTDLTRQVHQLTAEVHRLVSGNPQEGNQS